MARSYSKPSRVTASNGVVIVDGPDGVSYTMEPEAAVITSDRLFDAAAEALGQRRMGAASEEPTDDRD